MKLLQKLKIKKISKDHRQAHAESNINLSNVKSQLQDSYRLDLI
jgi:hypothetical protein